MITKILLNDQGVYDIRGLSTDTKPTQNIANGSTFFEMDTKDMYMLKVEVSGETVTATWIKIN